MSGTGRKTDILQQDLFNTEMFKAKGRKSSVFAVMYCDGASRGNPGKAGIGVVIDVPERIARQQSIKQEYKISRYIGETTNNVAEYSALIEGLKKAKSLGIQKIKILLDSELVVKQIRGVYKVKNPGLIPLFNKVNVLLKQFGSYKISHVPREENKEADALARKGAKGWQS